MSTTDQQLRWLRRGAERALKLRGERARHTDVIWQALCEALELIEKDEDQEKRWLSSGTRCSLASLQGMSLQEAFELQVAQMMDAMGAPGTKVNTRPATGDHDFMMDVLAWLRFCVTKRDPDNRLGKAVAAIALGNDVSAVARIMGRPVTRRTVEDIRDVRVPRLILRGLRDRFNLVPSEGLTFREINP